MSKINANEKMAKKSWFIGNRAASIRLKHAKFALLWCRMHQSGAQ
ncbi:hypothetical protein [Acidithiobacillus sp.]